LSKVTFDRSGQRILSRPIGVVWAGWQSNTFRLQQAGWELAIDYKPMDDTYQLMVHSHEGKLYGVSSATHLNKRMADAWNEDMPDSFMMQGLAQSIQTITANHIDFAAFQQIDATPQMCTTEITRVEDFNLFKTITTRAEEIIIEKADMSVIEHLQAIKDLQSNTQAEIRDRILNQAGGEKVAPGVDIHTNIVQLRARA
jgi:hypothetical protein